jgi:hypothetical protein
VCFIPSSFLPFSCFLLPSCHDMSGFCSAMPSLPDVSPRLRLTVMGPTKRRLKYLKLWVKKKKKKTSSFKLFFSGILLQQWKTD